MPCGGLPFPGRPLQERAVASLTRLTLLTCPQDPARCQTLLQPGQVPAPSPGPALLTLIPAALIGTWPSHPGPSLLGHLQLLLSGTWPCHVGPCLPS